MGYNVKTFALLMAAPSLRLPDERCAGSLGGLDKRSDHIGDPVRRTALLAPERLQSPRDEMTDRSASLWELNVQ